MCHRTDLSTWVHLLCAAVLCWRRAVLILGVVAVRCVCVADGLEGLTTLEHLRLEGNRISELAELDRLACVRHGRWLGHVVGRANM